MSDATQAVAAESEQKLVEVIVRLIEQPAYRLAGAEEALRQFCATVEQALQSQEPLAKELLDRSILVHQRLQVLLESPPVQEESRTKSLWKLGRRNAQDKNNSATELIELLKAFAKCRYQSLILLHVNRLYVSLRGHLSDQIREVGFCRQRLGELIGSLSAPGKDFPRENAKRSVSSEQYLLPEGCTKLEEAIATFDKLIGIQELTVFDQRIQTLVQKEYKALVQVCMGPSNVVRNLAPAMMRDAEEFLEPYLEGASVADLFIKKQGSSDADPRDALMEAYDEAAPDVEKAAAGKEICVVVVPDDEPGTVLKDALADVLPDATVIGCERRDEIIFYREQLELAGNDLPQLGDAAEEAFRQRETQDPGTLHCREDILEWQTAPTPCGGPARK